MLPWNEKVPKVTETLMIECGGVGGGASICYTKSDPSLCVHITPGGSQKKWRGVSSQVRGV